MNTIQKRFVLGLACIALPMLLAAEPAAARTTACEAARAGTLDARLAARAAQSPASLRRFITRTQTIYGLDWSTAMARANHFSQTRATCTAAGYVY